MLQLICGHKGWRTGSPLYINKTTAPLSYLPGYCTKLCHLRISCLKIDDLMSTLFFSNSECLPIHLPPGDSNKTTRSKFTESQCNSNHSTSLCLKHITALSGGKSQSAFHLSAAFKYSFNILSKLFFFPLLLHYI